MCLSIFVNYFSFNQDPWIDEQLWLCCDAQRCQWSSWSLQILTVMNGRGFSRFQVLLKLYVLFIERTALGKFYYWNPRWYSFIAFDSAMQQAWHGGETSTCIHATIHYCIFKWFLAYFRRFSWPTLFHHYLLSSPLPFTSSLSRTALNSSSLLYSVRRAFRLSQLPLISHKHCLESFSVALPLASVKSHVLV